MSNSVVKVTDTSLNDSLMLLVGEDGMVTPSKDVVDAYLSGKSSATNLQVMHINKTDDQIIEVAVNDMLYVPDAESECTPVVHQPNFDEIAYNLYNIKLDHDYTSQNEPVEEEVDELAKTLSILDGDADISDFNVGQISENQTTEKIILRDLVVSPQNLVAKAKTTHTQIKPLIKATPKKPKLKEKEKEKSQITSPEVKSPEPKLTDKKEKEKDKLVKKEKKPVKVVPDDFALFSTPDIIRRVGGKESTNLTGPGSSPVPSVYTPENKPAKIELRSKSATESSNLLKKQERLSLDGKVSEKHKVDIKKDGKFTSDLKPKRPLEQQIVKKPVELPKSNIENPHLEQLPLEDTSFLSTQNESKTYSGNLSMEPSDLSSNDQNMSLDANSLDLDPALLDNINNDLISDDILYQVAQSLVSNTELQNAIDKSLNEENLVLPGVHEDLSSKPPITETFAEQVTSSDMNQKGTQIVRPDGRIVVIPPIERPTTRSRNRRESHDMAGLKFNRNKPLDEEHVSGNELDSSGEEEEESEDDPNKLWCICNQPHNNRFMICCDTCEEWYHGKCVNITKSMGQQMESEGREWICLFCKDPLLKRPQAAAKRIRKASRNSRQSSDSNSSLQKAELKSSSVPCVVCQKPSRSNSIFCSEACILIHAQGVERVVVFERSTGNMLTGNRAPSAANLEQWLKAHPGYEVVRSAGKIVTTKTHNVQQSKLKLIKPLQNDPDAIQMKAKTLAQSGVKNLTKTQPHLIKIPMKGNGPPVKILHKQIPLQHKDRIPSSASNRDATTTPPKMKVVQTSIKLTPSQSKEKLPPPLNKEKLTPKAQKVRPPEQSTTPQPKQENIRENVQKTIFEQLTNRLKVADDLKLSEDELKSISSEIESQLYKCFGDTGQKYRNKYRSLIFNIKDIKNQTLWRRICEKSINPYQLVRLSPDDLASQELALWREREAKHQLDMIKKSELELLKCNRQYVLKTHKGEQILEDNRPTDHIDNTEVITSLTDGPAAEKSDTKKENSKEAERKKSKHSHKDKERKGHHGHRSSSRDHDRNRKRSRSREKNSKHGDRRRSRSRGRDRHRKSSHKSSKYKKDTYRGSSTEKLDKKSKEILEQLVENKIVPSLDNRLWKHVPQEDILPAPSVESDSDHEPTSTVTIPTPPRNADPDEFQVHPVVTENKNDKPVTKEKTEVDSKPASQPPAKGKSEEIWRGIINMIDVAQISITAHEVSGDCNGLSTELPANLDIVGRISPDTVWDYIGKMKCSNSKIISVVRLNAINVEEKMPYLALYSYLSSRNRLGVVKSTNKAVKDFYILPLASQKPIPQALLPLNGPGFEEARPALLLGIIVRDKRKRPYIESITPAILTSKKSKLEVPSVQSTPPARSYTPPPVKESRLQLPLPPSVEDQDGDEPYSPEDSDPETTAPSTENVSSRSSTFLEPDVGPSQTFQPFANKFDDIPGLGSATLPSSTQEIQRQMEKLNKEIEMQKSEINSISQNIATASTEIGTSALANIALPSNLQQILDSIKTIDTKPQTPGSSQESSELTIPLMLPTTFSRQSTNSTTEATIPLNLPSKKKTTTELEKASVLSSLSEADLIRKAEEMLEDTRSSSREVSKTEAALSDTNNSVSTKKIPNLELAQPPIPGLEDSKI